MNVLPGAFFSGRWISLIVRIPKYEFAWWATPS
jgi:hypothetical protein